MARPVHRPARSHHVLPERHGGAGRGQGVADPLPPGTREEHRGIPMTSTTRLTVAQALVRFLAAQYTERDGERHRLIGAVWGIFGHGIVAGIGQALVEYATVPGGGTS